MENKKVGYVLNVVQKIDEDYISSVVGTISYDFEVINDIVVRNVKELLDILSLNDELGFYKAFGGVYKDRVDNCLAEYSVKDLRLNTLCVSYKIFEIVI